jgi:hypothetical protein
MRGRAEPRRHANPRPGLVAGDDRVKQGRAVRVPSLGLGERGGDRVDAGVAARRIVALVEFERRAGEAVEEGRHRRRGAQAGAGQPARSAGRVAPGGRRHRCVRVPGDDGAERVRQHQPGAVANRIGHGCDGDAGEVGGEVFGRGHRYGMAPAPSAGKPRRAGPRPAAGAG